MDLWKSVGAGGAKQGSCWRIAPSLSPPSPWRPFSLFSRLTLHGLLLAPSAGGWSYALALPFPGVFPAFLPPKPLFAALPFLEPFPRPPSRSPLSQAANFFLLTPLLLSLRLCNLSVMLFPPPSHCIVRALLGFTSVETGSVPPSSQNLARFPKLLPKSRSVCPSSAPSPPPCLDSPGFALNS